MSDVLLLYMFVFILSVLNISLGIVTLITNTRLSKMADRVLEQVDSGREVNKSLLAFAKLIREES